MPKRRLCRNCILILALCILTGGIVITIANYIPINQTIKTASLEEIGKEGLFPEVPSMEGGYGDFHSTKPTALELATDSLMLKMALYEGEDAGIRQAFRCYSTQYEDEYSRYWHGYVAVLRVLLLGFDYYEIRIINGICQILLFVMAAFLIWKQKGRKYVCAVVTSYLLLMPQALGQCLQYSWIFYVTFGALFAFLKWREFWEKGYRYIYFFLLTGAVTIYLDLLTFPLLTWGLPIVWWLLMEDGDGRQKKSAMGHIGKVVASGIAWIAGYGGMWIGKWILGSIILRENLFQRAVSEALLWTVDEGESALTLSDRFHAIYQNWCTYDYKIYLLILVGWLLYWCVKTVISGGRRNAKAPALLLVFNSSLVWYLLLAGHTEMHHIFTHRIFGVSIAAFLAMVLLATQSDEMTGAWRYRVGSMAVFAGISVLSYGLMSLMKDEYDEHNGTVSFERFDLEAPVSMSFVPEFSEVGSLSVGIMTEQGCGGLCRIQLWDQETVLDEILFSAGELSDKNFHVAETDWKLEPGHLYQLSLELTDSDDRGYIWVTSDDMPLPEFGKISIGEEQKSGQMLAGISYWRSFEEPSKRILFTITFMGIGMMLIYTCFSALERKKTV